VRHTQTNNRTIVNYYYYYRIDSLTGRLRLLRALDAEADTVTYAITVGTVEMNSLIRYEHKNAYTCTIAISVTDVNDWIPNFKAAAAATRLSRSTLPGTVVMQVEAFDNDRSVGSIDCTLLLILHLDTK
jgi:hypothetical protein